MKVGIDRELRLDLLGQLLGERGEPRAQPGELLGFGAVKLRELPEDVVERCGHAPIVSRSAFAGVTGVDVAKAACERACRR